MNLNLPWTVDKEPEPYGAVTATDSSGAVAFTVPYDPDIPEDEDVARFTARTICDRVNAGEMVAP